MKDEVARLDKLRELESATLVAMSKSEIDDKVPKIRGLYAITCEGVAGYAYVGQAGERKGTRGKESGLWERLGMHWKSAKGDNLAKLLMRESGLPSGEKYNLKDQRDRRRYFEDRCRVQVVTLDNWDESDINTIEKAAIRQYCPPWNTRHKPKQCTFKSVLTEEPASAPVSSQNDRTICRNVPISIALIALVIILLNRKRSA
jgi:hypothetical protein